ncbi:MAG: polymer-forming cytoskeletal protein [Candidatus Kuenenia sp.]|nr:polymer-forming cytoskeletal protein [Candidatus Kuenenia hertensis]
MAGLFRRDAEVPDERERNIVVNEKHSKSRREVGMTEGNMTNLTPDTEFKGTIKFNTVLRIDGKFDGEMITDEGEVIVGSTGAVKANIKVRNAIVEGQVDGNIIASERVELRKKAKLMGDLQAKTLVIDEGVIFVGKCSVHPEGFKTERPKMSEKQDNK